MWEEGSDDVPWYTSWFSHGPVYDFAKISFTLPQYFAILVCHWMLKRRITYNLESVFGQPHYLQTIRCVALKV
jgi:hypothetical protein